MAWDIQATEPFKEWFESLDEAEMISVDSYVGLLAEQGVSLRYPYCSGVKGSKHIHMRELRIQHAGKPYRVFYAFDPQRSAILLAGGEKTGKNETEWYTRYIRKADALYDAHLERLRKEGGHR